MREDRCPFVEAFHRNEILSHRAIGFSLDDSRPNLHECIGALRMAAATSIVRIPTQLPRMRQVLSDIAPRNSSGWRFESEKRATEKDEPLSTAPH
jgi:hypothetical protein